jgi:hypothetical protein
MSPHSWHSACLPVIRLPIGVGKRQAILTALNVSPSGDCTLGTIMLAGAYFRQRGSIDQFASFDAMGQAITTNAFTPMVKQLLGIDRPAVA